MPNKFQYLTGSSNIQQENLFEAEGTQASYAILEGEYNQLEKGVFSIQLVRVPYNIELSIQLAREAKMPELEESIQELTTAKYRGLKK